MTEGFLKHRSADVIRRALEDPTATHYQALGVGPGDCQPLTLQKARLEVMKATHPDHNPSPKAHDWSARANLAYGVLTNPERRGIYDGGLRATHAECPACSGRGFQVRQRGFSKVTQVCCAGCGGDGWVRKPPRSFSKGATR